MTNPFILKMSARDHLSDEEQRTFTQAISQVREVGADQDLVSEGDRPAFSTLMLEGFCARYRSLADGRRQITALHMAGDFVDLHSFLLKTMDHGIFTLTPCRVAQVSHEALREISERLPHLTRLLWLNTIIDAAIHREWLVSIGRRAPVARIAHLICELYLRLQVIGEIRNGRFELPLTQAELADVLGISTVHANRSLQQLRREGAMTWQGTTVTIQDWERLQRVAEFDPLYLNLDKEPR